MGEDERIFSCDLNDNNLFNCILDEVGEEDLNILSISVPNLQEKTYINCLNASLVTCLRNNKKELDFPEVQLKIKKTTTGDWLIHQINIIVEKLFDDNLIYEKINQCLTFVKKSCDLDDSIQLSVIHPEIKENIKSYKVELGKINQLLQELRSNKSKNEELFSLFNKIATNK